MFKVHIRDREKFALPEVLKPDKCFIAGGKGEENIGVVEAVADKGVE